MKRPFSVDLCRREQIGGWIWLVVYLFLLSTLLVLIMNLLGFRIDTVSLNRVYYIVCFVVTVIVFWRFLADSLSAAIQHPLRLVLGVVFGYIVYMLVEWLLSIFCTLWFPDLMIPNEDNVEAIAESNFALMAAAAVLLAPLTEETLLRGLVFGSLRKKSRLLAYVLTALLFASMHVISYLPQMDIVTILLNLLIYALPSAALCFSYEYAGTIWAPILLHMLINGLSMWAMA